MGKANKPLPNIMAGNCSLFGNIVKFILLECLWWRMLAFIVMLIFLVKYTCGRCTGVL